MVLTITKEQQEARELAEQNPGQAVRAISDKVRWDWMPWQALEQVAMVFTVIQSTPQEHSRGIGKYKPNNWISGTGLPLLGFFRGATSHLYRFFFLREDLDPETNLHHLAHAGWNVICALETVLQGKGVDDRPSREDMSFRPNLNPNRQ
jgi:hypothetical protein